MKKRIVLLLIVFSILSALIMAFNYVCGYEIYRDVPYGEGALEIMDVFIPDEAYDRETNGCVILIHGGSWSGGDKEDEEMMSRYIASQGYIAATINYTLSDSEGYNVNIVLDEITASIEKIIEFCAEKQIIVDKFATYGYSAGGHLAMLYSYSRGDDAPCELMFIANMAGPSDINADIWGDRRAFRIAEILSGSEVTEKMAESGELDELLLAYSPVTYIDSETPPSIIAYGGRDTLVTAANGDSLIESFDANGVSYDYVYFPNSDHSLVVDFGKRIKFANLVIDYCEEYFE